MNEKQRERLENINHGATYGNRWLSVPLHSVIKRGRSGEGEEKRIKRREGKTRDRGRRKRNI